MNQLKLTMTLIGLFIIAGHAFGNYQTYSSKPINIDGVYSKENRDNPSRSFKKRIRGKSSNFLQYKNVGGTIRVIAQA